MRALAFSLVVLFTSIWVREAPAADYEARSLSLRAADARVAEVAYRLAVGAAGLCADAYPLTGMLLHHLPEYDAEGRRIQIERYRLDRGPGVLTVLAGGPAAQAGLLPGDVLLGIDGQAFPDPAAMAAEPDRQVWRQQVRVTEALIENRLRHGPVRLKVLRDGRELDLTLGSIRGCPLRVRLARDNQLNAFEKDGYVILTTKMLDFVRSDDELAVVIAHELAHHLLGHEDRLEALKVPRGLLRGIGKNAARVKATEVEADRLGLRLSWAAGYDSAAALGFWERFYRVRPDGLQIFRTHPGLSARKQLVSDVVAELRAQDPGMTGAGMTDP